MMVSEGVEWDKTAQDINAAVRRLREIGQDIAEVKAFAAARVEQLEEEQKRLWGEWREGIGELLAKAREADPSKKSIQLPGGVIQERTYAPKLKIVNSDAAIEWALDHAPGAIVPTVDPAFLGSIRGEKVVNADGEVVMDAAEGVYIPGVELVPERSVLYVQSTRRKTE